MTSYQRLKEKCLELKRRNLELENAISCFKENLFVYNKINTDFKLKENVFGISQQLYVDFNKYINNEVLKKMREFLFYYFTKEEIYKLYEMKKENK